MGVYFIGSYVVGDSDTYGKAGLLLAGVLVAATPDLPWWLRLAGAVMAVVGLVLVVGVVVRLRRSAAGARGSASAS